MNIAFYAALARLPLGIAVTLEFVGPLGVAVAGSRRRLDLLWGGARGRGDHLVGAVSTAHALDPLGVALALLAGAGWAGYILLNVRVGRAFPGDSGLALAMAVAALAVLPVGARAGRAAARRSAAPARRRRGGLAVHRHPVLAGARGAQAAARRTCSGC